MEAERRRNSDNVEKFRKMPKWRSIFEAFAPWLCLWPGLWVTFTIQYCGHIAFTEAISCSPPPSSLPSPQPPIYPIEFVFISLSIPLYRDLRMIYYNSFMCNSNSCTDAEWRSVHCVRACYVEHVCILDTLHIARPIGRCLWCPSGIFATKWTEQPVPWCIIDELIVPFYSIYAAVADDAE